MKPVCVNCGLFFKPKKNGAAFEEGMPTTPESQMGNRPDGEGLYPGHPDWSDFLERLVDWEKGWGPYKLWKGDLWQCRGCGARIIVGVAARPVAEHFEEDYAARAAALEPVVRVDDC